MFEGSVWLTNSLLTSMAFLYIKVISWMLVITGMAGAIQNVCVEPLLQFNMLLLVPMVVTQHYDIMKSEILQPN